MNQLKHEMNFEAASQRIASALQPTRLLHSTYFSQQTGGKIYLKPENLQQTGSFKIRGAYNKIAKLSQEERDKGLIAASAGNHAQGVAYAAKELEAKANICMPKETPLLKVNRTKTHGAEVILYGNNFDETDAFSQELAEEQGYTLIHPFDDIDVIEGQGTISLEIYEELPDIDMLLVPVGGGGLISGVSACMKELNPNCTIVGVESTEVPSMAHSVSLGKACRVPNPKQTIADGTAVQVPGANTYKFACQYVDQWIDISDLDLMVSFTEMIENHKLVVEPSGLLSVAALRKMNVRGKNVVSILSGGNIDMLTISNLVSRGMIRQGRIYSFSFILKDRPGALRRVLEILEANHANVINVNHAATLAYSQLDDVKVNCTIGTDGFEHIKVIQKDLADNGINIREF